MQSKQTQNTLTLIFSSIIALSMITLLYIILAIPDANSPAQIAMGDPAVAAVENQPQAPVLAAAENQQPLPEAAPTEPAAQEPQAESVQPDEAAGTSPETAKVNFIPVLIIAVIALAVGAGGFFLYRFIRNLKADAGLDDESDAELEELDGEEQQGKTRSFNILNLFQRFRGASSSQDEEETQDVDEKEDTHIIYQEGRGYCFNTNYINPDPTGPDEPDESEPLEQIEDDIPEEVDYAEPGNDDELELCREIDRLTDKVNDYAEKLNAFAAHTGLTIHQELVALEESDELPAGADALQQEVIRLKKRINAQVDYIEEIQKKQGENEEKADNNGNKEPFLVCVANALSNMQKNELVYKPQRQRGSNDYTYVPSAEFFGLLSEAIPDYTKKNAVEALKQHGILDNSEKGYDTVYNKKRVLKIYSKQFVLLTTEFAENVGA